LIFAIEIDNIDKMEAAVTICRGAVETESRRARKIFNVIYFRAVT